MAENMSKGVESSINVSKNHGEDKRSEGTKTALALEGPHGSNLNSNLYEERIEMQPITDQILGGKRTTDSSKSKLCISLIP